MTGQGQSTARLERGVIGQAVPMINGLARRRTIATHREYEVGGKRRYLAERKLETKASGVRLKLPKKKPSSSWSCAGVVEANPHGLPQTSARRKVDSLPPEEQSEGRQAKKYNGKHSQSHFPVSELTVLPPKSVSRDYREYTRARLIQDDQG